MKKKNNQTIVIVINQPVIENNHEDIFEKINCLFSLIMLFYNVIDFFFG